MQLTTWNPRLALRQANRNSRMFDEFFAPFEGFFSEPSATAFAPSVDIYEKDDALVIEAEIPGVEKEDIKVNVQGRILTLAGERNSVNESKENGTFRSERRYGKFERSFKLPFEVTEQQVKAAYRDGVLTLTLEKPEEQKPKEITIN